MDVFSYSKNVWTSLIGSYFRSTCSNQKRPASAQFVFVSVVDLNDLRIDLVDCSE